MPELQPDVARASKQNRARLVPDGPANTGYVLTVTEQSPFGYQWRQPPSSDILRYAGPPDGELTAPIGSLCVDPTSTPTSLWENDDGATSWHPVGGVGGFPLLYDDGTNTYSVNHEAGFDGVSGTVLALKVLLDADDSWRSYVQLAADGTLALFSGSGGDGIFIYSEEAIDVRTLDHGNINLLADDGGAIVLNDQFSIRGGSGGVASDANGIVAESAQLIQRGMNAGPIVTTYPAGVFGFWVDTSTWELKVRAHEGSGTVRNLTIGTLT